MPTIVKQNLKVDHFLENVVLKVQLKFQLLIKFQKTKFQI